MFPLQQNQMGVAIFFFTSLLLGVFSTWPTRVTPEESLAGLSLWQWFVRGDLRSGCSLTLKCGRRHPFGEKASRQRFGTPDRRLSTEDFSPLSLPLSSVQRLHAASQNSDSDPFLEFVIPLCFVTDCEELCDAKYTI